MGLWEVEIRGTKEVEAESADEAIMAAEIDEICDCTALEIEMDDDDDDDDE